MTTAQTVKHCYRVAVLRKPLDTSSLEQLPYTSVEGPLLVSGLQKSYLWIQGVCVLCFWCTMLGYLLYFLLFLELGEIRGKFSPFNSYSSRSTFYQERILNLLIGVTWVLKYLFLVRLFFGVHKTFKRGVFIVLVWNDFCKNQVLSAPLCGHHLHILVRVYGNFSQVCSHAGVIMVLTQLRGAQMYFQLSDSLKRELRFSEFLVPFDSQRVALFECTPRHCGHAH